MHTILKKSIVLLLLATLSLSLTGCWKKSGHMRDMYVAANINRYGQGVYNSGYFKSDATKIYVVAFIDTYLEGTSIEVSLRDKSKSSPQSITYTATKDSKVTYTIPIEGPFTPGKYEIKVIYDSSTILSDIEFRDNPQWPPLIPFIFNMPVLRGELKYTIYSNKTDTSFDRSIADVQKLTIEIPEGTSTWYRIKWIYNNLKSTKEYSYGMNEIKETNAHVANFENGIGYISAQEHLNNFPAGQYLIEVYQDIYNEPIYTINVEIKDAASSSRAAAETTTASPSESVSSSESVLDETTETIVETTSSSESVVDETTESIVETTSSSEPVVETITTAPKTEEPTTTKILPSSEPTHTASKELKVYMSSGLDPSGKPKDQLLKIPYGLKTPLTAIAETDLSDGTVIGYGLRLVNGDLIIASKAEAVQGPTIDGVKYTQTQFTLYNPETDNWPPGSYTLELYRGEDIIATSSFEIVIQ